MKPQLAKEIALFSTAVVATAVVLVLSFRRPVAETPAVVLEDLSGTSNAQLLARPLTKPVCEELLVRPGIPAESLIAALRRLSKLNDEEPSVTFFELVDRLEDSSPPAALRNLNTVSLHVADEPSNGHPSFRDRLQAVAVSGNNLTQRKLAFASLIAVDGSISGVLKVTDPDYLNDLLASLPFVNRFSVSDSFYDALRPFIITDDESRPAKDRQSTAIAVAIEMPHVHAGFVTDLIQLLRDQADNEAIILAMLKLPVDVLPEDHLGFIASQYMARLAQQTSEAASPDTLQLAERCLEIATHFPLDKRQRLQKRVSKLTAIQK